MNQAQFFQAARLADKETLLTLAHPEMIAENAYQLTDMLDTDDAGVRGWAALREITILSVTVPEETATATISITANDGHTISGRVALKKHQGAWRILDFD